MSEKILSFMYGDMKKDDEDTNQYYVVHWKGESYIGKGEHMRDYTQLIKTYTREVVCDDVSLNLVPNAKYYFTKINKRDRDVTLQLKKFYC